MIGYLKNSDVSIRLSLNPFHWKWIPGVAYDGPTPFYPKRCTFALAFLFIQAYIDIDNGTEDMESFQKLFHVAMDAFDEQSNVGHKVPPTSEAHSLLEQGPEY
jgi:hypothetical protein